MIVISLAARTASAISGLAFAVLPAAVHCSACHPREPDRGRLWADPPTKQLLAARVFGGADDAFIKASPSPQRKPEQKVPSASQRRRRDHHQPTAARSMPQEPPLGAACRTAVVPLPRLQSSRFLLTPATDQHLSCTGSYPMPLHHRLH